MDLLTFKRGLWVSLFRPFWYFCIGSISFLGFFGVNFKILKGFIIEMYQSFSVPSYSYIFLVIALLCLLRAIYLQKTKLIFSDNFSDDKGWEKYGEGSVSIKQGTSRSCGKSLKKDNNNEPDGGYLKIKRTIRKGFCFSGWIYSPKKRGKNAWGDSLSIEGNSFNGYGFGVAQSLGWATIERRDGGDSAETISERVKFNPPN